MSGAPQHHSLDDVLSELRPALRSAIADLAERLLGPPSHAGKREHRWGSNGSFRVTVSGPKQGACVDYESGWKGDPIALIQDQRRIDFIGAVEYGCQFAGIALNLNVEGQQEDPFVRAAREAEHSRRRAEAEAEQATDEATRIAGARRLWEASTAIDGTVAEIYLTRTRAIPRPAEGWPDAVRFHAGSCALILAGTGNDGAVQFVQRVRLTTEARKIDGRAKNTDGVMAGAFVRLPGAEAGPLMLAEGPETGLSIWVATGHETRLSAGPLPRHEPPPGRRVVVARDDDASQSPADKALARALDAWRKASADVVVATPWLVRRFDKSDFNDVIRSGGPTAVRVRIEVALAPSAPPARRVPVVEARRDLGVAIDGFVTAAEAHGAALKRAEAKATADMTAKASFPPEVTAARRARAAARAASAALRRAAKLPRPERAAAVQAAQEAAGEARRKSKAASAEAARFKNETQKLQREINAAARAQANVTVGAPPVHAVRVDVGAGKSAAARRAVAGMLRRMRASGDKRSIAFAVPTHALGTEQARLFEAEPDAVTAGLRAAIWRGREAADPDRPGKAMCQDMEAVADARDALADPQTSVCRKAGPDGVRECFFFGGCAYQAQRNAQADLWFVAHEMLFLVKPVALGDLAAVIVDESAWQDGLIGADGNHTRISLDTLDQYDDVPGQSLVSQRLRSLRKPLHEALVKLPDGPVPRSAVLATDITPEAASEAAKIEWMRKVDAMIYPNMPTRERKAAVRAAAINRTIQRLSMVWKAVEALTRPNGPEASGWISMAVADTQEGAVRVIRLKGCKPIASGWSVPTLLIDAILQPDLARPFWPQMEATADIRIETPHQYVIQVTDRSYSKRHLLNSRNLRDVHAIISREARALAPGRVLAVIQMDAKEELPKIGPLPVNVELAHHNAVAGKDGWGPGPDRAGVVALIMVGRTAPSPAAVERQAEALTGTAIVPLPGWYDRADAAREMADGTVRIASTDRHPHPVVEAIRWQVAEGELGFHAQTLENFEALGLSGSR